MPGHVGVGLGEVGRRDHPALMVEHVAHRARADPALGEILAEPGQRHVDRRHARELAAGIVRRGHREADQPEGCEDVGIGDDFRASLRRAAIPQPRARIVGGRLVARAQLLQVAIEIEEMIERPLALPGHDPAVGKARALRRQAVLQLHLGVDAARLAEAAVLQPDIDADDLGAVHQDGLEILEAADRGVELGEFIADRRGRPDQRLDGSEVVLDVVDRLVAEALDQLLGIGPGDAVVREISDGDDGEEDGDGEDHERRQDAGLEPHIAEDVHGPAVMERDVSHFSRGQPIVPHRAFTVHATITRVRAAGASYASRWPAGRRGRRPGFPLHRSCGRRSGSRPARRRPSCRPAG